jgi:hypothetical protein
LTILQRVQQLDRFFNGDKKIPAAFLMYVDAGLYFSIDKLGCR